MMSCFDTRSRMLEADATALDRMFAGDDDALAAHLAACPRCRTAAARIADGYAELRAALDQARPVRPVEEALELARRQIAEEPALPGRLRRVPGSPPRNAQSRRWRWAAAAAAATLAGALLLRPGSPSRDTAHDPIQRSGSQETPLPPVEEASGRDLAVFETRVPGVTVIWIF